MRAPYRAIAASISSGRKMMHEQSGAGKIEKRMFITTNDNHEFVFKRK